MHFPLVIKCQSALCFIFKEPTCQCRRHKRRRLDSWVGKITWKRAGQPTPVFLAGESHGQRILADYSPWGCKRVRQDLATKQWQRDLYTFLIKFLVGSFCCKSHFGIWISLCLGIFDKQNYFNVNDFNILHLRVCVLFKKYFLRQDHSDIHSYFF